METDFSNLVWLVTLTSIVICTPFSEASVVGTTQIVQGWKGEDIRLPCIFQEQPLGVYWVKKNSSDPNQVTNKAIFYDGAITLKEERFDIDSNFSLVITDLKVTDEGRYHCQVALHNLQDYSNSTTLTVSSLASTHAIEECVDTKKAKPGRCTYRTPPKTTSLTLTCVVSGFKPNISMLWTDNAGKRQYSVLSQQTKLSDDTFERFETITVSAKHGTEQTFMCMATGESVNGTSTKEITVLPISGPRNRLVIFVGVVAGGVVAAVILFLLLGKCLQKCCPNYLPRKGCGWNPCWWRKPESSPEGEHLMSSPAEKRENLRRKIEQYSPGSTSNIRSEALPSKVNISLFGEMAAGKSSFINSLNFAYKGEYSIVTEEGQKQRGGGMTKLRFHHTLTGKIDLIDNRGMKDFSVNEHIFKRLQEECNGKRSINPSERVERSKDEECHCAVFVYRDSDIARNAATTFIRRFSEMVRDNLYTSPIIVITHKNSFTHPESLRQEISDTLGESTVLMFENYTSKNHEEDVKKDVDYLEFLWAALQICDRTIYQRQIKERETPVRETWKEWFRRMAGSSSAEH
ncbi:uncharacterized protein [Diadema setosum]|uniref:uncharacterized protein n=1 Tax=Diadema setosum TaxID=31175 RepID=UPI003B3B78CA